MTRRPWTLLITALALSAFAPSAALAGMKISGTPKATFFAVGSPSFLNIEGVSTKMSLTDDGTKLTFNVPMTSVDSGVELRDQHMNDNYIQVSKFPNATISLNKADVPWPTEGSKTVTVAGTFTVHGVSQPASIQATVTKTSAGWRVKGKFNYDCNKHGITIETYMGVTIDPKMYATVVVDLVDAP